MAHNIAAKGTQLARQEAVPIEEFVGYQLKRAFAVFSAEFSAAVAGTDMRQVLVGILATVAAEPGINQGAVGRRLGIQRANMVVLINELIERGLIDRQAGDDRRSFALHLTGAGADMLAECLARIRLGEERRLALLSDAEKAQLLSILKRLNGAAAAEET